MQRKIFNYWSTNIHIHTQWYMSLNHSLALWRRAHNAFHNRKYDKHGSRCLQSTGHSSGNTVLITKPTAVFKVKPQKKGFPALQPWNWVSWDVRSIPNTVRFLTYNCVCVGGGGHVGWLSVIVTHNIEATVLIICFHLHIEISSYE